MEITIRRARLKDVDTVLNLWKEMRKDHNRILLDKDESLMPQIMAKKNASELFYDYALEKIKKKRFRNLFGVCRQ